MKVIFSDLDGTLVHFAKFFNEEGAFLDESSRGVSAEGFEEVDFVFENTRRRCRLLPTSTMGPGVMSLESIRLIGELRAKGIKFVYVTGARCSTIEERLPLMAAADAAFAENGGRFLAKGCSELDPEWTNLMEKFCGDSKERAKKFEERNGVLWDWARKINEEGYEIDTRSYFFGFRVDVSKQLKMLQDEQAFRSWVNQTMPKEISMATNLGKFDFYPNISGKGNAVRFYRNRFNFAKEDCVALFDDENDLPMAQEVGTCYVLQSTHSSVNTAIAANPHWKIAKGVGVLGTEQVLSELLTKLENCKF